MKLEGVLNFLLSEWLLSKRHRQTDNTSFCREMGVFNLDGLKISNGVGSNFGGNVVSPIELMDVTHKQRIKFTHHTFYQKFCRPFSLYL